jgi:hypothetical protein
MIEACSSLYVPSVDLFFFLLVRLTTRGAHLLRKTKLLE